MRVALSEEQALLAETVADMVERAGKPSPRATEPVPADGLLWSALVEAGLVGMRPVDGASAVEVALTVEQLARGPVNVPFAGTALGLELLRLGGASSAARAFVSDGVPVAVAFTEDLSALGDALAWDTRPGAAVVTTGAHGILLGRTGGAVGAIDLTRNLCSVAGAGESIGALTTDAATRWQAFALAVLCADMVGAMHATLLEAVEHTRTREQFGRAVGTFQAVQHLAADALVLVESARSVMWYSAWAVDALDADEALVAARTAKAYCSESGRAVCETAIQMWGGIGMTWECRAHLFLRRVLLARRTLGDEHLQLACLAEQRLRSPDGIL